jgi:hypothetical protein
MSDYQVYAKSARSVATIGIVQSIVVIAGKPVKPTSGVDAVSKIFTLTV